MGPGAGRSITRPCAATTNEGGFATAVHGRGDAALGAPGGEQRILLRVAVGQPPAARIADVDVDGFGADRVDVAKAASGRRPLIWRCAPTAEPCREELTR